MVIRQGPFLRALGAGAAAAFALAGWAWAGTHLHGTIIPFLGVLALFAASAGLGAAVTRHFGWALLVLAIAVLAFSTVGNAIIAHAHGVSWDLDPRTPPYYLLRALAVNATLGLVTGVPAIMTTLWWLELRDD